MNETKTAQRERELYKVTLAGSLINLTLVACKLLAGMAGHSAAMIADGIHSLSDLATDIVVLVFVRISGKPEDKKHDFGHGKYETLGTLIIGAALFLVGMGILWEGCGSIYRYLSGEPLDSPGYIALWAALVSIVSKELVFHYTRRAGVKYQSPAVIANAWHHRSDALSSIGTAIGIGGALLLGPDWAVLDPIAAIIVSLLIMKVSLELILPCVGELLEHSLPEEEERYIRELILSYPGVSDPHNLRTRRIGAYRAIEVHFRMDGQTTINEAHATTRLIEDALRKRFGQKTIINTHVEPVKNR